MKKMLSLLSILALVSCAHNPPATRKISSVERDLTGTYLGVADYGKGHKGYNKKAIRIYFSPIENEPGKYNVVLLEYVDLLAMAPKYITSNKLPFIAKRTGYLKNITDTVAAYEAVPGAKENTLELYPLVVQGDQIVPKKDGAPRILTLSEKEGLESPIAGATISSVREDEPKEIFFPTKDDDKRNGIQYGVAVAAYKVPKLQSTWRKNFLRGPYLSQYYRRDDVVLRCSAKDNVEAADFSLGGDKYQTLSPQKRTAMFTHPDSAFLKGNFSVTEPRDGMFVLKSTNADQRTTSIVEGKIAMFIDIFDATISLHQDVVELVFADSERPADFLMYYEDPKNGEGGPR
ncbi:MAG: hypothetical protein ACJ76H_14370 [Bacteriovoracaceae bacterium]